MRKVFAVAASSVIIGLALPTAAVAESHGDVAKEIMELAYDQWDAFQEKNVAKAIDQLAEEYTEFNPVAATRIDGMAMSYRLAEAEVQGASEGLSAEMLNPKVQVYGDVAILSYNYLGSSKDKDGNIEPTRAKSTRVYVKKNGTWKLVHANFGADPVCE